MDRIRRRVDRHIRSATQVEPFVRRIVSGGIAVVFGLWLFSLGESGTPLWVVGLLLTTLGLIALATGLRRPLDW